MKNENPIIPYHNPEVKDLALERSQQTMRQLKQRFQSFSEQVDGLGWEQVKNRMVETAVTPETAGRKRELLERLDPIMIIRALSRNDMLSARKIHTFRGHVFEYLVSLEMIPDNEDLAIAQFITDCLKDPSKLDLELPSQKNPDHIGVVVDSETGEMFITGMYEAKLQKLSHSGERQIKSFYYNLRLVVNTINREVQKIKEKFGLPTLPDEGITLKPIDQLYKYVVVSASRSLEEDQVNFGRDQQLREKDWRLHSSVFTVDDVDLLAVYLSKISQDDNFSV